MALVMMSSCSSSSSEFEAVSSPSAASALADEESAFSSKAPSSERSKLAERKTAGRKAGKLLESVLPASHCTTIQEK